MRIADIGGVCVAPQYVAADLLSAEGFSDVEYVKKPTLEDLSTALASGTVDFSMNFVANLLRTARLLTDRGFTQNYDYALQAMRELPYARWREYDQQDAVRFYALRLHEIGVIKSSPQKVMTQGTDWRFLDELKKELKG